MPTPSVFQPPIQTPDALTSIRDRIDAAYWRTQGGLSEWIKGSLELAAALIEARDRLGNVAFGAWLREIDDYYLNPHDQSALMKLGRDPSLFETILWETKSTSYRLIWEAKRIHYGADTRTNSNRADAGNRSNEVSTGRGPWTNVIDARLTALFRRGTTLDDMATTLSAEFGSTFTKGMCQNALRRLGLLSRPERRTSVTTNNAARATPSERGQSAPRNQSPGVSPLMQSRVEPDAVDDGDDGERLAGLVDDAIRDSENERDRIERASVRYIGTQQAADKVRSHGLAWIALAEKIEDLIARPSERTIDHQPGVIAGAQQRQPASAQSRRARASA